MRHYYTNVFVVTSAAVAVRLGGDERFLSKLVDEWATNADHAGVKGTAAAAPDSNVLCHCTNF